MVACNTHDRWPLGATARATTTTRTMEPGDGENSNLSYKMAATSRMECGDFLEFQDTLKKMRQLDDKIIYLLNTSIPTESFKGQVDVTGTCKDLFQQIQSGHAQREVSIKKCMNASRERVKKLMEERAAKQDDPTIIKNLRKEQNTLRMLESELGVEEVVKQRTTRVYYEKCRSFYKPPLNLES